MRDLHSTTLQIDALPVWNADYIPERWSDVTLVDQAIVDTVAATLSATDLESRITVLKNALTVKNSLHRRWEKAPEQYNHPADAKDHDAYCRIVRVNTSSARVLAEAVLKVQLEVLCELRRGGSYWRIDCEYIDLFDTLDEILCRLAGQTAAPGFARDIISGIHAQSSADPYCRWLTGHHAFVVIVQCLVITLNELRSALSQGNGQKADMLLALASRLLDASVGAFHFACDFSPQRYKDTVRPTMMPPNAPSGLSGLLSKDHRVLVQLLVGLKPEIEISARGILPNYPVFERSLANAYDGHKLICARFSGSSAPSLRMSEESVEVAVDVLEQFKQTRLRNLERRSEGAQRISRPATPVT
jgi:hypothetical protein